MVGCLLGIGHSRFSIQLSKFGIELSELGLISIAPQNLARAPESFRLSLRVEAPDVPVEKMTKTKAWSDLQEKLSGYAQRLELLEAQRRHIEQQHRWLSGWVSNLTLATSLGMLISVLYMSLKSKRDTGTDSSLR